MNTLTGYLRLVRPANIITAIADILSGIVIAGYPLLIDAKEYSLMPVLLLVLSTIGLYGGGVVFNDVFDAELDKTERPERPIPSGIVSKRNATALGILLLIMGIVAASFVHKEGLLSISALLAIAIALAAVVYDKWGKHHAWLGPVNMGLCRGLNLLLGISILPAAVSPYAWIAIFPILYISAITLISRGEVHGSKRTPLHIASVLYLAVITAICWIAFTKNNMLYAATFIILFTIMIGVPLVKAIKKPVGKNIGGAVKAGVLAVILMNAAWAAAFGSVGWAFLIFCLLPASILLAMLFAVT